VAKGRLAKQSVSPPENTFIRQSHEFSWQRGRQSFHEYAISYISTAEASLKSKGSWDGTLLWARHHLLLFPEVWIAIDPSEKSGWREYWITFPWRHSRADATTWIIKTGNPSAGYRSGRWKSARSRPSRSGSNPKQWAPTTDCQDTLAIIAVFLAAEREFGGPTAAPCNCGASGKKQLSKNKPRRCRVIERLGRLARVSAGHLRRHFQAGTRALTLPISPAIEDQPGENDAARV